MKDYINFRLKRMLVLAFIMFLVLVFWFFSLSDSLNHLIQIDAYSQLNPYTSCGQLCDNEQVTDFYTSPFKPSNWNYFYFVVAGLCFVYYLGDLVNYFLELKKRVSQ
jgi:hypothetical protein